uniref:Uncharacterized protein n=1 Tax=Leptocylindrus danicus TaxID=163516 RepID=A0A7S2PAE4_9STRA
MAKWQTTLFNPKCNLQQFVPSTKKQKKLTPLDELERKCLSKSSCFEAKFVCEGCNRHFINSQGLGNHKKFCQQWEAKMHAEQLSEDQRQTSLFAVLIPH